MDSILSTLNLILGATKELQRKGAAFLAAFLVEKIPGDVLEDDLADVLEFTAEELRAGTS